MRYLFLTVFSAMLFLAFANLAVARQDDDRLQALFEELEKTEDYAEGKIAEGNIWKIWLQTGSDTADYMVLLGTEFLHQGKLNEALETFTSLTKMDPGFAEGWNKRATVLFFMGEYEHSVRDIEKTLALEPRHFGALSGLGQIFERLEKLAYAIDAFERAVKINPHMKAVNQRLMQLKKQYDNQKI